MRLRRRTYIEVCRLVVLARARVALGKFKSVHCCLVVRRKRDFVLIVKLVRSLDQIHGRACLGRSSDVLTSACAHSARILFLKVQLDALATQLPVLV